MGENAVRLSGRNREFHHRDTEGTEKAQRKISLSGTSLCLCASVVNPPSAASPDGAFLPHPDPLPLGEEIATFPSPSGGGWVGENAVRLSGRNREFHHRDTEGTEKAQRKISSLSVTSLCLCASVVNPPSSAFPDGAILPHPGIAP